MDVKKFQTAAFICHATGIGGAHPKTIAIISAIVGLVAEKGEDITVKDVKNLEQRVEKEYDEAVKALTPEAVAAKVEEHMETAL